MRNFSDIYNNADIQVICSMFLYGDNNIKPDKRTYNLRLEQARKKATNIIEKKLLTFEDYDKIIEGINLYAAETEHVFIEIGFKMGLLLQLGIFQDLFAQNEFYEINQRYINSIKKIIDEQNINK